MWPLLCPIHIYIIITFPKAEMHGWKRAFFKTDANILVLSGRCTHLSGHVIIWGTDSNQHKSYDRYHQFYKYLPKLWCTEGWAQLWETSDILSSPASAYHHIFTLALIVPTRKCLCSMVQQLKTLISLSRLNLPLEFKALPMPIISGK